MLLDASLSLTAPGGRWAEARDSAARWGDVRRFGDERGSADTLPTRGRSLLAPALLAASASDRPVIVVTDGEIEDAGDIPPDLLAARRRCGSSRGPPVPTWRSRASAAPRGSPPGDSIPSRARGRGHGRRRARDSVAVEATLGGKRVGLAAAPAQRAASARGRLAFSSSAVGPGEHVLRVSLADAEATTSRAPTPGCIWSRWRRRRASSSSRRPADWDSRFLYRTLREVAQLPVRGFVRVDPERWRSMADLSTGAGARRCAQAARRADLLIQMGRVGGDRGRHDRPRHLALGRRARTRPRFRVTGISRRRTPRPSPARSWDSRWIRFRPAIQLTPIAARAR